MLGATFYSRVPITQSDSQITKHFLKMTNAVATKFSRSVENQFSFAVTGHSHENIVCESHAQEYFTELINVTSAGKTNTDYRSRELPLLINCF